MTAIYAEMDGYKIWHDGSDAFCLWSVSDKKVIFSSANYNEVDGKMHELVARTKLLIESAARKVL